MKSVPLKYILPWLMVKITRRERYLPPIEWSERSWVHNIFRAYELVFWREKGIRKESSVQLDADGRVTYEFYTVEAALAHFEGMIRGSFPKLVFKKIYLPQLAPVGMGRLAPAPYLFAIAFDTSGGTTFGAQPRTVSITTAGSERLMIMHTSALTDPGATAPDYNSVASTLIVKGTYPGSGRTGSAIYYLIGPTSGANTANFPSSGSQLLGQASNYTGCDQSSQVDSNGTTSGTSATVTGTTTVVASNCWLVMGESDSTGTGYADGTATIRQSSTNGASLSDSNGTVGTGSQSKTITISSGSWQAVTASIKVSTTPATLTISVTDSLTIAESISRVLISLISKTESITIAESLSRTLVSDINKSDSISITEALTMSAQLGNISVTDSITIAEAITRLMTSFINKSDSISIAESVTMVFVSLINVSDSITISETVTVRNTNLGGISVADALSIGESVTATNTQLGPISVFDSITISESISMTLVSLISVSDSIHISDSVTVVVPSLGNISVSDAIHITEAITMLVTDPRRGITLMRSKEQEKVFGMDSQQDPRDMRSKSQDYPLGMDDGTII